MLFLKTMMSMHKSIFSKRAICIQVKLLQLLIKIPLTKMLSGCTMFKKCKNSAMK